jgi:DNA repair exonuclease SbcCD ATPase subunit
LLVEQRERAVVVETRQLPDAAATADLDPGAVAAVEEACAAIRADGSPVSRRNNAIEERRAAILRRDECLREAGLPGGPPPQGVLPTTENVNAAKRLWAARQDEHKEAQRKLVDARRRLSKLRTRLNVAATDDVPTADSLATLRRTRDDVVAQLVKAWLDGVPAGEASELPGGVARAIDAADTAADRLFRDAKAAGERARLAREAAEAETESAELTAKVEDLAEEVRLAAAAWTSLWYALGRVPAVDDALQLRQHIAAARTAHAEVAAADSVVHELREQQERQTRALATALAAAGRPRPAADLDSLLVAADQVRRDSNDQQVARALAAAAQRRVQDARHASDEARRDHDAMVTRWQTLARSAGLPPHVDQAGWTRRQQIVGAAAKAMREAEDVGARARALRARHDAFVASLRALADRHGAGPGDDVAAAMEELAARLATAVTAGAEAGRLDERIQLLARDAEGKAGELAAANVVLETCRAGAGVADLEELAVAAQRGRTLAELAADVNRLTDLVTVALPDVDVERDVPELAATDPDELDAAVDEAERKLLELSELLETARNRRAEVVEQHRILTGRPGAAQARAQAQERLAALEDCAERYVVAHIQRTILAAELAEYERQHATSLLAAAGKLLDDLTGGRYVGLRAAHQGNSRSLVVVTAAEELRAPSQLSEGTADQVYLALRLAGIAALQAERRTAGLPTLPVVLDDVLMTFDDERAAAALRVMAELARDWQLIVFSHHVHLADVAESLGLADSLTVSHLPPPETVRATRAPEAIRALATASGGDGAALPVAQPVRQVAAPDTPAASHIREWARRNGHQLADRGRIPVTIIQAYEQANSH